MPNYTNANYLTALMAADAACIATVNLPADSRIRKLARDLRDALNESADNGQPTIFDSRMPNGHIVLGTMARHAARHIYYLDE